MKLALPMTLLAAALWAAPGCKNGAGPSEGPAPSASSGAAPSAVAAAGPSASSDATPKVAGGEYAILPDEDIPVAEEFAEESAKAITEKNYKKELEMLEKELAAPEE